MHAEVQPDDSISMMTDTTSEYPSYSVSELPDPKSKKKI